MLVLGQGVLTDTRSMHCMPQCLPKIDNAWPWVNISVNQTGNIHSMYQATLTMSDLKRVSNCLGIYQGVEATSLAIERPMLGEP
jgi:hypothetical protein